MLNFFILLASIGGYGGYSGFGTLGSDSSPAPLDEINCAKSAKVSSMLKQAKRRQLSALLPGMRMVAEDGFAEESFVGPYSEKEVGAPRQKKRRGEQARGVSSETVTAQLRSTAPI